MTRREYRANRARFFRNPRGGPCGSLCTGCAQACATARPLYPQSADDPSRPLFACRGPARSPRSIQREAHLPAQEAQARPHARLPRSHADARRPHRPQAPSRQGPQAADGLVTAGGSGGRRRRRLSRSAEFERVYRQGRSKANRYLVLYAFPREEASGDDGPRLGISVSRRVGGAVDRTRVKRVLREAFWQEAGRLPTGSDYVIVARPEARGLAEREGTSGIRRALSELIDGLGGAPRNEGADA